MTEQNQVPQEEPTEFELDSNGYITLPVWVCVDADGAYETGTDIDQAGERHDENIGGHSQLRMVRVNVRLRVPQPVETSVHVSDEAGTTVEIKAE